MKNCVLILSLLPLMPVIQLSAQVKVEVVLEQEHFLSGEALPAIVKIRNRSGQTLHMGREPDWLTFTVESNDGLVVAKAGEAPVVGEFVLGSSQVATKKVDLAPYFALTRPGRYSIIATVRIKEWDRLVTSEPKSFDIINGATLWSQEFGVPAAAGATNEPPEVRRYTLQEANYLRKQLRLYLRLTDMSESRVIKVVLIGPLFGFSQPEPRIDNRSQLHLLYQNGARSFSYMVFNPDGKIVLRQTHDYIGSRPRLHSDKDGKVSVVGGVRRETSDDLPPPPKKADEAKPSKP